ncbi:MAG: NAD-dependent deacylase [Rhodocyclaceae bacterium]|nr:NAD-dependent deacylase [Rhodocyclaceae bacterium]MCP5231646.1 NAD-dependent deacylase [Zoogloeaceae bacterium]MCB1911967.1 NAD-dependent deacylase [Rhodocyclaceae bacterium]MCP5240014.1 NAD-dependent deacylase [Zoogloeaceae bacterium]MCP5253757.1 NAD-dependent deacylase [Zoogloeaceae bacterium]
MIDPCQPVPSLGDSLDAAAALLRGAGRIAVLSGAGISAESGIPTFRDALTGLWARFDAGDLATPEAFERDPALVWGWYEWRRMKVLQSQPNPGHLALARLAARGPQVTVITQNVDDLHERAGSREVHHLHGSLHAPRCFECGRSHGFGPQIPDEPEGGRRLAPPACDHCGGPLRPGVVWFGEMLPEDAWRAATEAIAHCEVMITIGTSGLVFPAAGLPGLAAGRGKPVIQINPTATEHDDCARVALRARAGEALPALLERLG